MHCRGKTKSRNCPRLGSVYLSDKCENCQSIKKFKNSVAKLTHKHIRRDFQFRVFDFIVRSALCERLDRLDLGKDHMRRQHLHCFPLAKCFTTVCLSAGWTVSLFSENNQLD